MLISLIPLLILDPIKERGFNVELFPLGGKIQRVLVKGHLLQFTLTYFIEVQNYMNNPLVIQVNTKT